MGDPIWIDRIEAAWKEAPIAWLSGVRRSVKTTLVLARARGEVDAIKCTWNPGTFDASSLETFRSHYRRAEII